MSGSWLNEVKTFQTKHGCTYGQAMKGAKIAREHGGMEGEGVIDYLKNLKNVILHPIKSLAKKPKDVEDFLNNPKGDPRGDKQITNVMICRTPLRSFVKKILTIGTKGDIDKAVREEGYDNVFHLYLVITLSSGDKVLLERNQRVVVRLLGDTKCEDSMSVKLSHPTTLRQLLDRGEKANSSKIAFFIYDPVYNNCQRFVSDLLRGSNMESEATKKFVNQDATKLVKSTWLQKFGRTVTDVANLAENALKGGDMDKLIGGDFIMH